MEPFNAGRVHCGPAGIFLCAWEWPRSDLLWGGPGEDAVVRVYAMDAPEQVEEFPEKLARRYLPKALQETCMVMPKRLFAWGSYNVFLLGIGLGIMVGAVLTEWLPRAVVTWGFPISLGIAWLVCRLVLAKEEKKFYDDVSGNDGDELPD